MHKNTNNNNLESIDDFVECERFRSWVFGNSPEDREYWETFRHENPEKRVNYELAAATLLIIRGR